MKYPVALVQTEEGFSVSCPGLPGCWSQGATEEEALTNIQDAIREYIEVATPSQKFEAVEAIRLGIAAAEEGRVKPARQALTELQAKLGISG